MPRRKTKVKDIKTIKGMSDILPKDEKYWFLFWKAAAEVAELHGFHYIETPILEYADLFELGIGSNTDIVEKEMYTFETKGGERVALRPEGTAPVMRSYVQNHLGYFMSPVKLFYNGPMFRYENPQAGREREFHQWGFEIIGEYDVVYDFEIITMILEIFQKLKLGDLSLKVNTIGCKVCRPAYRTKLKAYYRQHKKELCDDCKRRYERNIFRLLDCKVPTCVEITSKAPTIYNYLCHTCNQHFKSLLELLEDNNISYEPDPILVRGLDYYNRTVFEIFHKDFNFALAGGGRYDYLFEVIGGRPLPAVGGAIGIERVIEVMKKLGINWAGKNKNKLFIIAVGDQSKKHIPKIMAMLRQNGFIVLEALGKKSLSHQLKAADKAGVNLSLILGQKEIFEESIIVRNMKTGVQETVLQKQLVDFIKKNIK
ncbi:MAG: histidine--tRNA ligase [Minisyncoccia bacterium]